MQPSAPGTPSSTQTKPGVPAKAPGLLPALGCFTMVMMVVGGVIGSGIFRKPGVMAQQLGSPELLIGVWVLAGIITLFGTLTNAEIAGMIPETGGQYVFFERIYGPFTAYLYGWAVFAVIQTGSIAAIAYVFAEYAMSLASTPEFTGPLTAWSFHLPGLGDVTPFKELGAKLIAAALILILTGVNYIGVKLGGMVQNIFTIAKVAAMGLLALGAFLLPNAGNLTTRSGSIHPEGLMLLAGIAAALQGAFWAYDGWNKITYIAGEVQNPQKNLPRSMAAGMLIVTAIYVLMNVAFAYVLPIDVMAKSKLVAADVAERCVRGGGKWVALAVMLSTFGAVNATILTSARVYFSMAQRRTFPNFLGRVHPKFRTPGASLLVQGIWSALLLLSGTFDTLTDTLIFVSWVFYAAGAYGVFVLRRKEPSTPRPYKVPGYPVVPAVFVLFALVFLALTLYNDIAAYRAGSQGMINALFGSVLVLVGAPLYWIFRSRPPHKP